MDPYLPLGSSLPTTFLHIKDSVVPISLIATTHQLRTITFRGHKEWKLWLSIRGQESNDTPRERKLPPQKTQSFKGGNKSQSWLRRQFSGEMSRENDLTARSEYATAIAAAASAIYSIEETQAPGKLADIPEITITRSPSRKEGSTSRRFSGETSKKKPEVTVERMPEWSEDLKIPKKVPSIKKTATVSDKNLNDSGNTKLKTKTNTRPPVYETFPNAGGKKPEKPTPSRVGETKADAWERAEMTKIHKRYERMNSTILSWEKEKKAKAKRRMDRIESEIERRRARATQRYRSDMSRIDQIAGGARAVADEKRRDDETKTKEKANKLRSTGNAPTTCGCF